MCFKIRSFSLPSNVLGSAWPCLIDPISMRVTQNAYFSLLTHTNQLLLVPFCDPRAGIVKCDRTNRMDRWTGVNVEIPNIFINVSEFST